MLKARKNKFNRHNDGDKIMAKKFNVPSGW